MRKSPGFTLIEVMVSIGIVAIILMLITSEFEYINQTQKKINNVIDAEKDFTELYNAIKFYTERTHDISLSYASPPAAGYFISGDGAIGLQADLRPCSNFNPNAPVWTPIVMMCCNQGMTTSSGLTPSFSVPGIATPSGGYTSACVDKPGFSMQVGGNKVCYPHINKINIMKVGYHSTYGSFLYFFELPSNKSLTGDSTVQTRALTLFFGLGNTGGSSLTLCRQSLGQ